MGDSIVKHIRGYELSRKEKNYKVYVKSFLGAKVMCMEDYLKSTLREMPTHIILHVGTNEVPTKKAPYQITENIVKLAIKLKRNSDVSISDISVRNDQYQKKAAGLNWELEKSIAEKKIKFFDHGKTISVRHLNASKLHLNKRGTLVLSYVFAEAMSNITNRQFVLHSLASDNRNNRSTNDYDENKTKSKVGALSASNLKVH